MQQGDLVVRRSYGGDVAFSVRNMVRGQVLLKGVDIRLLADSPVDDLIPASSEWLMKKEEENNHRIRQSVRQLDHFHRSQRLADASIKKRKSPAFFEMPGVVLHMDGDYSYLRKCMALYEELRIPSVGYYVPESDMARALVQLLPQINPDILVITGHDGILKEKKDKGIHNLASYKNSHNFVSAVQTARKFDRGRDSLVIIAGACQSHFEALLKAGANFASSPGRVLIHALDPLYIASKVSFTSIKDTVQITDVLGGTLSGLEGLGGVETRGCHRIGIPHIDWQEGDSGAVATIASAVGKLHGTGR